MTNITGPNCPLPMNTKNTTNIIFSPNGRKASPLNVIKARVEGDVFRTSPKKHVRINGETVSATQIDENTVLVNDREYKIKKTADPMACDKTKDVVVIEGKRYDLRDGASANFADLPDVIGEAVTKSLKDFFQKDKGQQ